MSVPDELLDSYFRLLLGREVPSELTPRDAKRLLAHDLVARFHSPEAAAEAASQWDQVFVKQGEPDEIEEADFSSSDGVVHMPALIAELFGVSRSEARRLITSGGIRLDDEPIEDIDVSPERLDGRVLRIGRRQFRRLRAQG